MTGKNNLGKSIIVSLLVTALLFLAAPAASAADNPGYVYYQVQPGDYLWIIGWRFETTVAAIMSQNNLTGTDLRPGQILKIPKSTGLVRNLPTTVEYTVKKGDSLFIIGQKFGISSTEIMNANALTGTMLNVGQVLTITLRPQTRYTVQNGDTLFLLAQKYAANIEALKLINRLNSDILWVGQVLFVPKPADSGTQPPAAGSQPADNGTDTKPGQLPSAGQWGEIPPGVVKYRIQSGDNLWILAQRFNTTESAIMAANHLHSQDLVEINQTVFIPQNSSQPVTIPYPVGPQKEGFGELLDWQYASWIYDPGNTAAIKDLDTGKSFRVRRLGGSNHADSEPLTAADSAIMKEIYGGQWSWDRRAVLVYVDGQVIAGSMAGMPHSIEAITDNDFPGHFDLYFLNSTTHYDNSIDPEHQQMVLKAAGNIADK